MSIYLLNDLAFLDGGVSKEDMETAVAAAEAGEAEAQYHIGLMFDTGRGVERNAKKAHYWYSKAAVQNHAKAAYYLAKMYDTDTSGIPRNDAEAVRWYKVAADAGHFDARLKISN